jgi:F0F1-type ATP synthase assembly protein I
MLPRTVFACWIGAQGAATGAKDLADLMKKQGPMAVVVGIVLLVVALAVMQRIGTRALRAAGLQ